ncbi:MAG: hypothetical protein ACQESR_19830 [Planctomycetota bacterium]
MERCPTQAVLPLVGLATENVIGDRYRILLQTAEVLQVLLEYCWKLSHVYLSIAENCQT